MRLTLIRKAATSGNATSPALYRAGDDFVIVGRRLVDPAALRQIAGGLTGYDIALVVPEDLIVEVAKNY